MQGRTICFGDNFLGVFSLLQQHVTTVSAYKGASAGYITRETDPDFTFNTKLPGSPKASLSGRVFEDLKILLSQKHLEVENVLLWFGSVDVHLNYFYQCLESNVVLDYDKFSEDVMDNYFIFISQLLEQFRQSFKKTPKITLLGVVLPTLDNADFFQGLCKYLQILDNQKQYVEVFFEANRQLCLYDYRKNLVIRFNKLMKDRASSLDYKYFDIVEETLDQTSGRLADRYKTKFQKNMYLNWESTLPIWFKKLGPQYGVCQQNLIKPFEETKTQYQCIKNQKEEIVKLRQTVSSIPQNLLQDFRDQQASPNTRDLEKQNKLCKHSSMTEKSFYSDRKLHNNRCNADSDDWKKDQLESQRLNFIPDQVLSPQCLNNLNKQGSFGTSYQNKTPKSPLFKQISLDNPRIGTQGSAQKYCSPQDSLKYNPSKDNISTIETSKTNSEQKDYLEKSQYFKNPSKVSKDTTPTQSKVRNFDNQNKTAQQQEDQSQLSNLSKSQVSFSATKISSNQDTYRKQQIQQARNIAINIKGGNYNQNNVYNKKNQTIKQQSIDLKSTVLQEYESQFPVLNSSTKQVHS